MRRSSPREERLVAVAAEGFRITVVASAAQTFIGARREVAFGELDEFIATTAARARAAAGGAAADPFTIFHRPVSEGRAGEVEVGVPVDDEPAAPAGLARGELPAGEEATLTVIGAQAAHPAVLAAYAAVQAWAAANDRTLSGPPREVYVQDPPALRIVWPLAPAQ